MIPRLYWIGGVSIVILGLGHVLRLKVEGLGNAGIAWAIASVGILTLIGLLTGTQQARKVTTRFAIAVSATSVWFASSASMLFYTGQAGTLADEAYDSLSLVMTVVIAFYFGSKAYEAVAASRASQEATNGGSDGGGGETESGIEASRVSAPGQAEPQEVWD